MNTPYLKLLDKTVVPIRFTRTLTKSLGYFDDKKIEIAIDDQLRGEALAEVVIHECLHALEPKWLESVVKRTAKTLAATLFMEPIAERMTDG